MITPQYVRVMAAYNTEMNRRVFAAAARLSDGKRREDGGLYWCSIQATLNHLIWADQMWMARFTDSPRPAGVLNDSGKLFERFNDLAVARAISDRQIEVWAQDLAQADIDRTLVWYSGSTRSERRAPMGVLITHFFNHQTHHRAHTHALLTRAGEDIGDTDLFVVVPSELFDPI